jgi:hypothetical protein
MESTAVSPQHYSRGHADEDVGEAFPGRGFFCFQCVDQFLLSGDHFVLCGERLSFCGECGFECVALGLSARVEFVEDRGGSRLSFEPVFEKFVFSIEQIDQPPRGFEL